MNNVTVFDEWKIHDDVTEGSGRGRKKWLKNVNTREVGLFKYPKEHTYRQGVLTGEHWAEKIASDLASIIGIPCAKTEIGTYNGEIGVMSYLILDSTSEVLVEGVQYITKRYPGFDVDRLYDRDTEKRYSVQMIKECIEETNLFDEFIQIPVFDCLIGNTDRHQSNWGIITDVSTTPLRIAPLYDNGSSLCCRIKIEEINEYFNDELRFKALIGTKSLSAIAWANKKKTRHFELMRNLYTDYFNKTINIVRRISDNLTNEVINEILKTIPDEVMSASHKSLVDKFLKARRDEILRIYNLI